MKAAAMPIQRPPDARLLVAGADGRLHHAARAQLADHLRPGDLLVANDAATMPASLTGIHERSGAAIEIRLAGRRSLARRRRARVHRHRFRRRGSSHPHRRSGRPARAARRRYPQTGPARGHRAPPAGPPSAAGAGLRRDTRRDLGRHRPPRPADPVRARPRAAGAVGCVDRVAALPVAFEPPSAGFVLDWTLLEPLRSARRRLRHPHPRRGHLVYRRCDPRRAAAVRRALLRCRRRRCRRSLGRRRQGGDVIALGTTVTRALEHAASRPAGLRAGAGLATQRIGPRTRLRVVDAIVTGMHEPGTSHYELLRAFATDALLERIGAELEQQGYRSHEFGDAMLLSRRCRSARRPCGGAGGGTRGEGSGIAAVA